MAMCKPQKVQLDCRKTDCEFYKNGGYCSTEPEITLCNNKSFACWSFKKKYFKR
jgi:hypothetical protein